MLGKTEITGKFEQGKRELVALLDLSSIGLSAVCDCGIS